MCYAYFHTPINRNSFSRNLWRLITLNKLIKTKVNFKLISIKTNSYLKTIMNTNHSISGVATWSCTNQMYIPFREPTIVYNPLLFKESQVHSRRPITSTHSLYQFRSKTVVPSAPMMPAKYNLTPSFSYSRKVFIGGLPPDIDEGNKTYN